MSVLTREEIRAYIQSGKLAFEPALDAFQMQPHAVDLRLGYEFRLPKTWALTDRGREALSVDYLNPLNGDLFEVITLTNGQYFEVLPGEFVIVTTLEKVQLSDDVMSVLYPRTSFNRRGLAVDLSGIIDVRYKGHLTIPVRNNTHTQTIRLYPGERMCQIIFQTLASTISEEDALMHGLTKSKYHEYENGQKHSAQPDKDVEMRLVREGKIDELKKTYPAL